MTQDELEDALKKHLERGVLDPTDTITTETANMFLRRINPTAETQLRFDGQKVTIRQVLDLASANIALK